MDHDILVVEDDPGVAAVLGRVLRRLDVTVECVGTGREALARLDGDAGIGLVVLDLGLPDIDGGDVCRSIRADGFAGRILALSARYGPDVPRLAMQAGADEFMSKPFTVTDLESRARALLTT